nr:MAG TPA: hypothetical protein [Caudoviricetes sp.]
MFFFYELSHRVNSFSDSGYFPGSVIFMIYALGSSLVNLCDSAD